MTVESIDLCKGTVSLVWFAGRDVQRAKLAPSLLIGVDVEDWPSVDATVVPRCN